jgi:hypothetical protein
MDAKKKPGEGVASKAQNDKLKHSEGGVTTRDDALDLGVPMLPGDPSEPQGPEDALGEGPKRGDYRDRLGGPGYQPHQGEVPQRLNADDIGDAKGLKGGVTTAPKAEKA